MREDIGQHQFNDLRIPPHSEEAERGILGSILLEPDKSMAKCSRKKLTSDHFYDRRHQELFNQIVAMSQTSKCMDAITISEWLKTKNAIEKVGGYDYLAELQGATLVPAHVDHYCDIVIEKYMKRKVIEKSSDAIDSCYGDGESEEVISKITSSLVGMKIRKVESTSSDDIADTYVAAASGSTRCIPTPFDGLTHRTGGPMRGMETILTGRAKSGKSMLKSFWHRYLGLQGKPALDCPWEDGELIARSRCASVGRYNAGALMRGGYYIQHNGKWEWNRTRPESIEAARRSLKELDDLPLYWDEERVQIEGLRSKLARYVDEHGIQLVFLDGAKDILRPAKYYNDTGYDEAISHGITECAREMDIAIVSIYHLTKLQQDELIKSTHIRGSGNIVSNARLVYALQGDKSGASLGEYHDARPLEFNEDGYCTTRVLECIDTNHGDLGKTWLSTDLGLCSFSLM